MKSRFEISNLCLVLRCVLFGLLFGAIGLPHPLALAESSSSYFGNDDDLSKQLNEPSNQKPGKPLKRAAAKSKTKELELSLDDASDDLSLDDENAGPGKKGLSKTTGKAPKKPKKLVKRTPAPVNLRFDKERLSKNSDLSLETDGPAESAVVEVAMTPEVQAKVSQAEELEKTKRWTEIVTLLKPVTESLNRTGLLVLAQGFAGLQNPSEEVRILDLIKNKYANDYVAVTKLGLAYAKIKKNAEALQAFYNAKEMNARYRPAYDALLNQLQVSGNSYEARSLVEDMIERFGKVPRYLTTLCRLLTKDAFLDKAVETCEAATERDPNVPENYVNLAIAQKDKIELKKALTTINDAAGKFPLSEPVLVLQGQLYMEKKDFANAYEAFHKATAFAVRSVPAWVGSARASFELHKYKDSLEAFKHACKVDPHSSTDFREMAGRLHKDKNNEWEYKFRDSISSCGAGA